jgi:hypothetical protein
MSERKWYLLIDEKVTGPFSNEEIKNQFSANVNALVWCKGQAEWISSKRFDKALVDLEQNQHKVKIQNDRIWKVKVGSQELRPMTQSEMIEQLKNREDFSDVLVWTEGYSEWKEIFQIHKIMDELGVSRRIHPRVPIMGTLACEGATGSFTARVLSISEGGLGITEANHVKIGERFKALLKSPNLMSPVHTTVEVVYLSQDGYAGLKFSGLPSEAKSAIIDYVKKFSAFSKNELQK